MAFRSRLAYLRAKATCPNCSTFLDNWISFQWGHCPASQPLDGFIYREGDRIRWRKTKDGEIPAWAYFQDGEANIGDPLVSNLITTDVGHWSWGECPTCSLPIGGALVEISEGVIKCGRLFMREEFSQSIDVFLVLPDGTLQPQPEWFEHPMQTLAE